MKRIFSEAGLENYSPIQLKRSPMQMVIRDEIARIIQNFRNTQKYKKSALRALNILMYATFSNSYPPSWSSDDGSAPVVSYFSKLSEEDIRAEVGDYYLDYVDVKWIDIPESSSSDDASIATTKSKKLAQNSTLEIAYSRLYAMFCNSYNIFVSSRYIILRRHEQC